MKLHSEKTVSVQDQRKIMIKMLGELTEYLDQNGLRYYLAFGTLLGAVRHKGMIPWDDDIDICMPLEDCYRLAELAEKKPIAKNIIFSHAKNNAGHIWPCAKVINTDTYLVEPVVISKYEKMQETYGGIYIDIFPIYGVPDGDAQRNRYIKTIRRLNRGLQHASRKINYTWKKNPVKRFLSIIRSVPYRLIGLEWYLKMTNRLAEKYPMGTTTHVDYSIGMDNAERTISPVEEFKEVQLMDFEGMKLVVPQKYDALLKRLYGDYWKLPPEEERKVHSRIVYYR